MSCSKCCFLTCIQVSQEVGKVVWYSHLLKNFPQFDESERGDEKASLKLNIQKTKIMASGPISSWQINGETMETVTDFIFLGSKITADGDCSHEIVSLLLLGRKAVTNLYSILKGRGTRDQIANIHWIIEKAREFQKKIYSASLTILKSLTVWITTNCGKLLERCNTRPPYLTPEKPVCRSRSNT